MVVTIDKRQLYCSRPINHVGNNMNLKFSKNDKFLAITGNNISVDIERNYGLIKVLGNNCKVTIGECHGFVEYCGNNGQITVFGRVEEDTIKYFGNNGNIVTASDTDWKTSSKNYPTKQVCAGLGNYLPSAPLIIENNTQKPSRSNGLPHVVLGRSFITINNY